MWTFRLPLVAYIMSQTWQWYCCFCMLWVSMWLSSVDLTVNARVQMVQMNGFSPVCMRICRTRSDAFLKLFGHMQHLCACFCSSVSSHLPCWKAKNKMYYSSRDVWERMKLIRTLISLMRSIATADAINIFSESIVTASGFCFAIAWACSSDNRMKSDRFLAIFFTLFSFSVESSWSSESLSWVESCFSASPTEEWNVRWIYT